MASGWVHHGWCVPHSKLIGRACCFKPLATGQTRVIAASWPGCIRHAYERVSVGSLLLPNVPVLHALTPTHWSVGPQVEMEELQEEPAATTARSSCNTAFVAPLGDRCDPGRPVRNTPRDARVTGDTPFTDNVRTRRVPQAMTLAGPPPRHAPTIQYVMYLSKAREYY
jgi:hypothetical protein